MKIMIVRHGEPDYSIDSLTEKGWKEVELLGERLAKADIKDFYVSSYGRAKDTAKHALELTGKEAEICDWLREFCPPFIDLPGREGGKTYLWDWKPEEWTAYPELFDAFRWTENDIIKNSDAENCYRDVTGHFEKLINKYGYYRNENGYYTTEAGNHDTICLVCHFGLECVLLSYLLNISPMVLWHSFLARPSSVTTLVTEEREKGRVLWRMVEFGDTSHLYAGGLKPSSVGLFRE